MQLILKPKTMLELYECLLKDTMFMTAATSEPEKGDVSAGILQLMREAIKRNMKVLRTANPGLEQEAINAFVYFEVEETAKLEDPRDDVQKMD